MTYEEFLLNKSIKTTYEGIEIDYLDYGLFDYQKETVKWALKKGKAALFEGCGLGKTRQQLAWANEIFKHTNENILILAPLGVTRQTALEEAPQIGVNVTICRSQADVKKGINITNYEMLEHFETNSFIGVVLDESSILKNFTGATRMRLTEAFKNTKYKLCCTATPAPNDLMELLNHADFLDIMTTAQSLSNFFINDMKTGTWRLKGHAIKDFYKWCCSWSINIDTPKDLGFDDSAYLLPRLNEIQEVIEIDLIDDTFENGLFRNVETSATAFRKEQKITSNIRAKKCAEIVKQHLDEQFIIWCDTNQEADDLKKYIPSAIEVRGSHSNKYKEEKTEQFKSGEIRVLISKPKIFGYGMNFQMCHNTIFCGLNYSYENYYQALRRIYRFGQAHEVTCWIVIGSTELHILDTINKKRQQQEELKNQMNLSLKEIQILSFERKEVKKVKSQSKIVLPSFL